MAVQSNLWNLMRWADSALPIGGYAYSSGLESMIQTGGIKSLDHFEDYLYVFLAQSSDFEIPFANSVFDEFSFNEKLVKIFQEFRALQSIPSLRQATISQGKAWIRLHGSETHSHWFVNLKRFLHEFNLEPFLVLIMSLTARLYNVSLAEFQKLWMHCILRDQLSAAVRLGLFGPMESNRIYLIGYRWSEELLAKSCSKGYEEAVRTNPIPEMAAIYCPLSFCYRPIRAVYKGKILFFNYFSHISNLTSLPPFTFP